MAKIKTSAQILLQGKRIVGVDDDCDNQLILMLEDGRRVKIEVRNIYVGNGMTIPKLDVDEDE